MKRTHTCNALRPADAGQTVTLVGWVDTKRDLGGVTFIDLRDREGVTQVVFNPGPNQEIAQRLKTESVIQVTGKVTARSAETVNPKLGTAPSKSWPPPSRCTTSAPTCPSRWTTTRPTR